MLENISPVTNKKRLFNIEFLRIVFTLCILYRHFFVYLGYNSNAWLAVEFFFCLSGFMFLYSWREEETLSGFLYKKFIRFMPLTVFGVFLCSYCQTFELGKSFKALKHPLGLADFFMLNGNGLIRDSAIDPPAWYISVMILLLTVLFLAMKSYEKNKVVFVVFIVSYLSFLTLRKYGYAPAGGYGGKTDLIPLRVYRGLACVGLGFLGAVFVEKTKFVKNKTLITFFEVVSLTAIFYFMFKTKTYPTLTFLMCLADTSVICLFAHNGGFLSMFLNKPFWGKVSKYMLSLYLTHYAFVFLMLNLFQKYNISGGKNQWYVGLLCLLSSFIIAVLAHHLIEKPVCDFLKKR